MLRIQWQNNNPKLKYNLSSLGKKICESCILLKWNTKNEFNQLDFRYENLEKDSSKSFAMSIDQTNSKNLDSVISEEYSEATNTDFLFMTQHF